MVKSSHGAIVVSQGIHGIVSFEFDSAAIRLATTEFNTEDRYKVAYQIEDGTFWFLIDEITPTWVPITFSQSEYDDGYSGTTKTIDWSYGRYRNLILNNDCVLSFIDPTYGADNLEIKIIQDSTPRAITWDSSVKWEGGSPPTLSSGAGAVDIAYLSWRAPYYYARLVKNFA
jgi:hypothetical protein